MPSKTTSEMRWVVRDIAHALEAVTRWQLEGAPTATLPPLGSPVVLMPVGEHERLREVVHAVVGLIDAGAAECVADGGTELCPTCIEQRDWAERLRAALAPADPSCSPDANRSVPNNEETNHG